MQGFHTQSFGMIIFTRVRFHKFAAPHIVAAEEGCIGDNSVLRVPNTAVIAYLFSLATRGDCVAALCACKRGFSSD